MTTPAPPVVLRLERLSVVEKPAGLSSEDAAAALHQKLVHRIDAATSGLLLVADDARTVQRMQRALQEGRVQRTYTLVAHGRVADGELVSTLVRDRGDGLRGSSRAGGAGKHAALAVRALASEEHGAASLCEAVLVTGRTHQIRIQLAEAGHPLVGERVYIRDHRAAGRPELVCSRLLLHARRLSFVDPSSKRQIDVTAPLPEDFLTEAARVLGVSRDLLSVSA